MKTIIAGSRDITNYNLLSKAVIDSNFSITEVVCGLAKGVDMLGEAWATQNSIPVKYFPADWDSINLPGAVIRINKFGKKYNAAAGSIRNGEMAAYADALILIHHNSNGSLDMLKQAKQKKLLIYEVVI